jgi:hypothetical protein
MNKLLYELEQEFKDTRRDYVNKVIHEDLTIRQLLDLGFNMNYLSTKELGTLGIGFKSEDNYWEEDIKLTEEVLNCKIDFVDLQHDSDCYSIIFVRLKNEEDIKYFKGDEEDE